MGGPDHVTANPEGDPLNTFRNEGGGSSYPGGTTDRSRIRRGSARPFDPGVPETLRSLYERYCDTEARELLALIPREGLRSLWGRARERAIAGEGKDAAGLRPGEPPMEALEWLRAEARDLLPLPPYESWVKAYVTGRAAFLERMGIASVPERSGPVTVAVRPVNAIWWAHLNMERRDFGWVGHIAFHMGADAAVPDGAAGAAAGAAGGAGASGSNGGFRTTDIFRGESPEEIRDSFREFTSHTLEGFLRSVHPESG
jgi:hypothetical protein